MAAQLPPAPGEPLRAITAGTIPPPPPAAAQAAAGPDEFGERLAAIRDDDVARAGQQITRLASGPVTPPQFRALGTLAEELGVMDDNVCTDEDRDVWETLREFLNGRWQELTARSRPAVAEEGAA